jgi:hypothetical protein
MYEARVIETCVLFGTDGNAPAAFGEDAFAGPPYMKVNERPATAVADTTLDNHLLDMELL